MYRDWIHLVGIIWVSQMRILRNSMADLQVFCLSLGRGMPFKRLLRTARRKRLMSRCHMDPVVCQVFVRFGSWLSKTEHYKPTSSESKMLAPHRTATLIRNGKHILRIASLLYLQCSHWQKLSGPALASLENCQLETLKAQL